MLNWKRAGWGGTEKIWKPSPWWTGQERLKTLLWQQERVEMNEKGLQGAAAERYLGQGAGDLPCPGTARRKGMLSGLATSWFCKLLPLTLTVELFPHGILPAGSAPLLSGSTSSVQQLLWCPLMAYKQGKVIVADACDDRYGWVLQEFQEFQEHHALLMLLLFPRAVVWYI